MKISRSGMTVGLIIILVEIFLLISVKAVFPQHGQIMQDVLMVYLILQATVLAAFAVKLPGISMGPENILLFAVGFIGTLFLVVLLPDVLFAAFEPIPFQSLITATTMGFLILYAAVKAWVEEVIWRGILLPRIGNLPQAMIFGAFHFAALSVFQAPVAAIIIGTVFLTALGYIWGIMAQRGTILFSTGSHLAYNLAVVGIAAILI